MGLMEAQIQATMVLMESNERIDKIIEHATIHYSFYNPLGVGEFRRFLEGFADVCKKHGSLENFHQTQLKNG